MPSKVKKIEQPPKEPQQDIFSAVNSLNAHLSSIEKFISRRFDEISMEINATSQQVDMTEDTIVKRFAEILEILGSISYSGAGDSAANTGVELEAVIEETEDAANNILDAADRIMDYVTNETDWNDPNQRESVREKIQGDIQEILLACTFQDLTGQRIRNTLNNLHQIESRLSSTFERLGIKVEPDRRHIEEKVQKASSQDDIDALLADMNKEGKK